MRLVAVSVSGAVLAACKLGGIVSIDWAASFGTSAATAFV